MNKQLNDNITGDSKAIVTNQDGIHEHLEKIVNKHCANRFQKPYQAHTLAAFEKVNEQVKNFTGEIILDSCCGVGQSTRLLAQRNPTALVIGVDKSANRLNRNVDELTLIDKNLDKANNDTSASLVTNFHLVRANLNDFYRLVDEAKWPVSKHYILYPNPWPKSKHVQRRWHGSAVFPTLMNIGEHIILRSNWLLYLEEFQFCAALMNFSGHISQVFDKQAITPFEAKFKASEQPCWQLEISASSKLASEK